MTIGLTGKRDEKWKEHLIGNSVIAKVTELIQRYRYSTFVCSVSLTFSTKIAVLAIGFGSSIITARYLGTEGLGIYAVLMAIVAMGIQFGNFGLHGSNTYFVAKDRGLLAKIVGNTLWLSLVGGTAISLITLGIVYFNQNLIAGIPISLVVIALLAIPFGLLFMLGENILLGIQRIRAFNGFELAKSLVTFLAIVVLLVLLGLGVRSVIVAAAVLAILFGVVTLRYLQSIGGKASLWDISLFKQMASYGLKIYVAALFGFLVIRFDILMVNYFLGAGNTGVYSITAIIADILYMLPVAIGMILFPTVSSMKQGGWEFTKKVAWLTATAMAGICVIAALFARPFITFFYGEPFAGAAGALLWLLPGTFVLSVNTIFMNFFAARGMPVIAVISPLIALITNILLNIYFIPHFGINGASMTSSIAYFIMLIASLIYLKVSSSVRQ